jgi:hypothetical protein
MDRKIIVFYLLMKGMGLDAIHEDFVRTLGKEAMTSFTVTKHVRNARFVPKIKVVTPNLARAGTVLSTKRS